MTLLNSPFAKPAEARARCVFAARGLGAAGKPELAGPLPELAGREHKRERRVE